MSEHDHVVGRAAVVAAITGTVLAPLHALSRYTTEDGVADLEQDAVRAWAVPAADAVRPLLDWAEPDTVYATYGKLWAPLLLTALTCAVAVRRHRTPTGAERWGWRLLLLGLAGATVGTAGSYWTPLVDESFVATLPFALLSLLSSVVLGTALLRRRFEPKATAVLLALWLPLFVLLTTVASLGAGLLPLLWAWGVAGRSLARSATPAAVVGAVQP